ncbi:hypothetical protein J3F84DRAFT_391746 [Trichoderma pleuroticola]
MFLMADGSTSKKCPCIKAKWSFNSRKKIWTNVGFIVVQGYMDKYDALITCRLPFLKDTENTGIHNSAGRLVFPSSKECMRIRIRFLFTISILKLPTLDKC